MHFTASAMVVALMVVSSIRMGENIEDIFVLIVTKRKKEIDKGRMLYNQSYQQ